MEYKGIVFCSAEVGRELTQEEIEEIKKKLFSKKLLTNKIKGYIINT